MTQQETFQLPLPTSRTIKGPRINLDENTLVVSYDFEHDDGSIHWSRVVFYGILAFQYRQNTCCRAEDIDAYNKIVRRPTSDWMEEMRKRLEEFLGNQADRAEQSQYAHWSIYFDDAGCIDAIAQRFEVA
jgi:hypothetical protein